MTRTKVRFTFKLKLLTLGIACSVGSPLLAQEEPIGRVVFASGGVQAVSAAGASRTLSRGAPVFVADTIITAADGTAQVRLLDDGLISFQPGTEFQFAEFTYDGPGAAADSTVMTMVKGGFRTITGTIGEDDIDEYRVDTPYASIGIRGTTHEAVIDPVSNSLITGVWDGGTTVFNNAGALDLGIDANFDFSQTFVGQEPVGLLEEPLQLGNIDLIPLQDLPDEGDGDGNADGGQAQALAAAPPVEQGVPEADALPLSSPAPDTLDESATLISQRADTSPTSILAEQTGDDTDAVINPVQNAHAVTQFAQTDPGNGNEGNGNSDNGSNGNVNSGNNSGNGNSGNGNSGNSSGNDNSSNGNSDNSSDNGNSSNGNSDNSGNGNSGNGNSDNNSGNGNSGNGNSDNNSGNGNSGNGNAGSNSGSGNSDNGNAGSNSGSGNSSSGNSDGPGNGNGGSSNGNDGSNNGNAGGNGNGNGAGDGTDDDSGNGNGGADSGNSGNGSGGTAGNGNDTDGDTGGTGGDANSGGNSGSNNGSGGDSGNGNGDDAETDDGASGSPGNGNGNGSPNDDISDDGNTDDGSSGDSGNGNGNGGGASNDNNDDGATDGGTGGGSDNGAGRNDGNVDDEVTNGGGSNGSGNGNGNGPDDGNVDDGAANGGTSNGSGNGNSPDDGNVDDGAANDGSSNGSGNDNGPDGGNDDDGATGDGSNSPGNGEGSGNGNGGGSGNGNNDDDDGEKGRVVPGLGVQTDRLMVAPMEMEYLLVRADSGSGTGPASVYTSPEDGLEIIWGYWNKADTIISPSNTSGALTPWNELVYWASVLPADMDALRELSGQWTFSLPEGDNYFMGNSGSTALSSLEMGFNVDLGSGVISEGRFAAQAGTANWSLGFSGAVTGARATMDSFTDTLIRNGIGVLSREISGTMEGVFTGDPNNAGFATGFSLEGGNGSSLHGLGLLKGSAE